MAAANANFNQTIPAGGSPATETVIFQSGGAGGSQRRGVKAITIYNGDSAETLLVSATPHTPTDEWGPIPPGNSITIDCEEGNNIEIGTVKVKPQGSTQVTAVGWIVTRFGIGSINP